MPGLADLHTHLSYGNARSEEELDLYGSLEYRTLRALAAAQRMLKSGYTALLDPACAGLTTPALRDALFVGMFTGPRITTGGPAITSRQGLYDYYPSWVGCPPCSTGELVRSPAEAIEAIRRQTKDGVDIIKLAMDGIQGGNHGGLYAAFTQEETTAMVREAQRLGRRVAVHARGREGVLYAARAGADILFHASRIDDDQRAELADARVNLRRAYDRGVPILTGSETGFAVTPYGEWAARELELMVDYLDLPQDEVLQIATHRNRAYLRDGEGFDSLSPGKFADILIVDGDPLTDIAVLPKADAIVDVWLGGKRVSLPDMPVEIPRHPAELAQGMWNRVYTRASTGTLRRPARPPRSEPDIAHAEGSL
jgi:imidazolonepropionase-like amidohydrolase